MEATSQRKYFKGLRALALTALFCTIALTLFIWGEALTPGDKSAIQSVKVSDNIQSAMKSDEPAPPVSAVTGYVVKSVRRDGKVLTDVDHYYTGDVLELGVKCLPENADTSKLYFERGFDAPEDYISVEENGKVTLLAWGYHRVVIKSKDNPDNALYDFKIYSEGVNPDKIKEIKTKIYPGDDIPEDGIITLETCEEYFLSVTAVTDDEYNGYGVSTIETEILINGEKHNANDKIFFLPAKQWFYPLKPTDGDYLILEIKLGDKTVSQRIRIVEGSKPEATGFTFDKRVTENDDGSFSLAMKKDEHLVITSQLGFRAENESEGAPSNIISKSSDTNVVNASTTHLHAYKPGTATITYFSIYDNTITATLHVTVPDVVDGLTVVAPDRCVKGGKIDLTAYTGGNVTKNVKWEVVKGEEAQSTKTACLRPTNRAKSPCAQRTSAASTLPSKRRLPCPSSTPSTRLYEKGSGISRFFLCWGLDCSARSSYLLSRDGRHCPFPCFRRLSSQAFRKCSNCPFSQADDTQPGRTSQSIFWARCRASASPLSRYRSSGLSGLRQNPKVSKI